MKSVFSKTIILLTALLFFGACKTKDSGNQAPPEPSYDRTEVVLAKVSGHTLRAGNTSLSLSANGQFELLLDADVRHFAANPNPRKEESDARCFVKLTGSVSFEERPSEAPISAHFLMEQGSLLSSAAAARTDLDTVSPAQVCDLYVKRVLETHEFTLPMNQFDFDFINFAGFDLNIKDGSGNSRIYWQFNSRTYTGDGYDRQTIVRNNLEQIFFVREGSQVDLTQKVLVDLDGSYTDSAEGSLNADLSAKTAHILLGQKTCGRVYDMNIQSIYATSYGVMMSMTITELKQYSSPMTASSDFCDSRLRDIESLRKSPVKFNYLYKNDSETGKRKREIRWVIAEAPGYTSYFLLYSNL